MPGFAIAAAALAILFGAVLLARACASVDVERTVLLHVPSAVGWEFLRHYPTLHAAHARSRSLWTFDEYRLLRGDGESAGSAWHARGRCGDRPCWAEFEIVKYEPGKAIAVRLARDSFGTHRGLSRHVASLTLEESASGSTKLTSRLRARLTRPRLWFARLVAPDRLQARLLDVGLRSIKADSDAVKLGTAVPAPYVEPKSALPLRPIHERTPDSPADGEAPHPVTPPARPGGTERPVE